VFAIESFGETMNKRIPLRAMLLGVLSENKPLSAKEIVKVSGINEKNVWDGLYYWWRKGLLLRAEKPTFENKENFKGRRGLTRNTRSYYLMTMPEKEVHCAIDTRYRKRGRNSSEDLLPVVGIESLSQMITSQLPTTARIKDRIPIQLIVQTMFRKLLRILLR
jgi:hypothetical protein